MIRDRSESIGWCCAAAVVIILVAGLLVAVRDTIGNTNVALILVVFVVAAAVFGGRLAGFTAAVVAAISFNFFHTQPYLTLRIKEGQDIVTVLLLLVVGLVVGELALLRQRTRHEVVAQATGAHVLEEVLALLAADSTVDQTWSAVRDGIQTALGVQHARFWPGAGRADLPLLTRSGRVVPTLSTWTGRGFQLPETASIPVVSGRGVLGHIEIDSTPGRSVSIDERRVAVGLADVLALALERTPQGIAPLL
jgi:K+-sensing histidine kinase KdpD